MGTSAFAMPILEALIHTPYSVEAVYTQPDKPAGRGQRLSIPPVKRLANQKGIPVFQPTRLKVAEEIDRLRELKPDIVVLAAYGKIIPQTFLDVPPFGCLNVHPSLLPRHRGASPIAGALLTGDEETGVTIFLMDAGMDTGKVLAQKKIPISLEDNSVSLTEKLAVLGAQLLVETLTKWFDGQIDPEPQDESQATYTRLFTKEDGEIDWSKPVTDIWRRVRALQPWPGCFTIWKGKMLKVIEAYPLPGEFRTEIGRAIVSGDLWQDRSHPTVGLAVQAGDGLLLLRRVQEEGGKVMSSREFLQGHHKIEGDLLGKHS